MIFLSLFKNHPQFPSTFNKNITIKKRYGHRALVVDGVTQSGGELTVMWESVAKSLENVMQPKSCLMLGLAGGTMLTLLQSTFPKAKITCIEVDPTMTKLAKDEFHVESKNTTIVLSDAFEWCISAVHNKMFDCIVVDLYLGRYNPPQSRTKKFIETLKSLLTPYGVICFNSHYDRRNKQEYDNFLTLLTSSFSKVTEIYSYPLNKILLLEHPTPLRKN